jgi:hypothetical protein
MAHFGADKYGECADFSNCQLLKKVQGTFLGATSWCNSGIVEIDPKTLFGVNKDGESCDFEDCEHLRPIIYAAQPKGSVIGNVSFRSKPTPLSSMDF